MGREETQFKAGATGGPGRPKGSRNRLTSIRDEIAAGYERLGGFERFCEWAGANYGDFVKLMVRLAPKEPDVRPDHAEAVQLAIEGATIVLREMRAKREITGFTPFPMRTRVNGNCNGQNPMAPPMIEASDTYRGIDGDGI